MASAQTEDEICNSTTVCLVVGAIFLIMLIYSYYQKQKQAQTQAPPDGRTAPPRPSVPQPYGAPGDQYAPQPQPAPAYQGSPPPRQTTGYAYTPQPQRAPHDYEPMTDIAPARRHKKASPAAACPRCGSTNVQNFGTGEHKCLDCKKIFMD